MKIITAAVLLILFLFSTKPLCFLGVAANQTTVLDLDGDELRPGVEYYIRGALLALTSGWLDLGSSFNSWCPKFVVQNPRESDFGRPVVFYPANTSETVVRESTDLNIMFLPSIDAYCRTSNVWKVDDYDRSSGQWWVTHGGVIGNPGPQTLTSWFKLHRVSVDSSLYHIRFCPSVCESCATLCNSIMRFFGEDQQIRLGLAPNCHNGWLFWFVKASSDIKQVVGN